MVGRVIADRWHDRVERLSSVSHPGNAFGSALLIEPCGVRGGEDDGGIHPTLAECLQHYLRNLRDSPDSQKLPRWIGETGLQYAFHPSAEGKFRGFGTWIDSRSLRQDSIHQDFLRLTDHKIMFTSIVDLAPIWSAMDAEVHAPEHNPVITRFLGSAPSAATAVRASSSAACE